MANTRFSVVINLPTFCPKLPNKRVGTQRPTPLCPLPLPIIGNNKASVPPAISMIENAEVITTDDTCTALLSGPPSPPGKCD